MDPQRIGPYEIGARLGAGGMGVVFRARDTRLRRDVAIKRLPDHAAADPRRRRNLLREARSAARISHQNVAHLYDVVEDGDHLYLVMELVPGRTLRRRLVRSITLDAILDIALQVCDGLAAAHREGVVHGDIKPDNLMVADDGSVKILDFGVASLAEGVNEDTETQTVAGGSSPAAAGTVPFMAPEVLLGNEYDQRADIFSLGVTLYSMLTGTHPFAASTGAGTVDRILHQQPVPAVQLNPLVPGNMLPVIEKMLAKSPEQRYATVDDLVVDLRAVRTGLTRPDVQPSVSPPPGTATGPVATTGIGAGVASTPRPRWVPVLAAVALVAVAGLALWQLRPGERSAPAAGAAGRAASGAARFDAADWVIAVLPVTQPEDDPELEALEEGLAATLTSKLTQLSRAHDLQVIPTRALRQRGVEGFAAARGELGVTLAVDFHLRRVGDQLRVNVNLVDTAAERQLDAATVDGHVEDSINLEEQVAIQALRMLRLELLPMEERILDAGTSEPRAHGYYLRARGYLQEYADAGSIDAAVSLLEQALRVDPAYARAHAALGEAFWNRYRLTNVEIWVDRSIEECQAAIDRAPDDGAGHRCLGTLYNGTGRFEEAAAELEQAKELDPTDDATYIALGSAYQNLGRLDRAEATYQEAVALRPQYWGGYSWLGVFYLRQGRMQEAIENLQQVVLLAPDSYRGYSNLGGAYYYDEDWAQARRAYERALELNPDYHSAISNLATVYFYDGDYTRSARMFERAVAAAQDDYLMQGNLADAYTWAPGERDKAAPAYRRAVELADRQLAVNPQDADANSQVARYHAMLGNAEQALAHLQRALEQTGTENETLHAAAQVYEILGNRDEAIAYLRRAIAAGYQLAEIAVDPVFDQLRTDPRYAQMTDAGPAGV